MDVEAKAFDDGDFYDFKCSIKELERRLGSVVSLAFDDCSTVSGKFKLLDSFEGLLERPIIQDELEKKYISLVLSFGADLKIVQEIFLSNRDNCPIAWNLPPIAGALTWCRGLIERIDIPFNKLNQLEKAILEREETKEVSKIYSSIKSSLQEYESQKIEEWGREVELNSHVKLKHPLLIRNPETRNLYVNFDPALVRLLREVKYFLLLGLPVPELALEIYSQVETFRRWTGNLDLIVNMNNDILNSLIQVEKPLVLPYLSKFDTIIEKGLNQYNWKSQNINEYISESMDQIVVVSSIVKTMKDNLKLINDNLHMYNKPLLQRKNKPINKEEFEKEHKNLIKERYTEIKEGGKAIHTMVKDTNKVLRISNSSNDWRSYIDYINNIVVDGLVKVVITSLEYLYDQIDPSTLTKDDKLPMIEVKLDLISIKSEEIRKEEVRFIPPLEESNASPSAQPVVIQPSSSILNPLNNRLLDLRLYETAISKYESIRDIITQLPNVEDKVSKGLDIEVNETQEGKIALMSVMEDIRDVRKAMDLTADMFHPLQDIIAILKSHSVDLSILPAIGNENAGAKSLQDYLDDAPMIWDALVKKTFKKKEEILSLQINEVESLKVNLDIFYTQMREFRNMFRANAPFGVVVNSTSSILNGINLANVPVNNGNVNITPIVAYKILDKLANELLDKEMEAKRFNELEELFELQVTKYPEINDTRAELKLLKLIWDSKALVASTYDSWNSQLWNEIKTDDLEDINKILLKNLRKQGNDFNVIKSWPVYKSIEDMIKNMTIVLPLINELHSQAMRDRHWKTLSKITKTKVIDPTDAKFTFEEAISLNVHLHVEDVEELVETANKELKIEKKLKDIETIWKDMTLTYVPFSKDEDNHNNDEEAHSDGIYVIKPSEEVIEALESHQLELQSMIGMGKFVDFFKDRVMFWQSQLGSMEDTLKIWVNVSRSWTSLESIFLASADIRSQLPDDTKRFEGIDSEFKELMKDAITQPNCLSVCLVEGRHDILVSMMSRLDLCQKSLNEYLDQKKKIFPRFYFVSNVALLDMLANGTNPPKIMKYLGDCYDSLNELTFFSDEKGVKNIKLAVEMIAKDGERLPLSEPFPLEGEVERYLNNLTEAMRLTLKLKMLDGYNSAASWEVDKPRHDWLFNFPAQVVVTTTQIYWTEESEASLEDLAGGQEDAVKRYLQVCDTRLAELIKLVLGQLSSADRTKIITIITLDVHARDVIQKLVDEKVEGIEAFLWQQQLRFYWINSTLDTEIKICDFRTKYFYEWIGT
eukprot:gene17812-23422_t